MKKTFIIIAALAAVLLSPLILKAQVSLSFQENAEALKEELSKTEKKGKSDRSKVLGERLIRAVKENDEEGVYAAVWAGADINYVDKKGRSAISYAFDILDQDNTKIVKFLLDGSVLLKKPAGIRSESIEKIPLGEGKTMSVQRANLKLPSNDSSNIGCYMWQLVLNNRLDLFKKLLDRGVSPDSRCYKERYPLLSLAIFTNPKPNETVFAWYEEAAKILIEKKADLFAKDELGNIPMHYAVFRYAPELYSWNMMPSTPFSLLLKDSFNQDKQLLETNKDGVTPLMASIRGNTDPNYRLLKYFLEMIPPCSKEKGECLIDKQKTKKEGYTVYMIAARRGLEPFCLIRVKLKPSEDVVSKKGLKAYDYLGIGYRSYVNSGRCEKMLGVEEIQTDTGIL